LRGAKRRSNPFFLFVVLRWIASLALAMTVWQRRVRKGALRAVLTIFVTREVVGTLRFAHPTGVAPSVPFLH
jgi:hypothetical protein